MQRRRRPVGGSNAPEVIRTSGRRKTVCFPAGQVNQGREFLLLIAWSVLQTFGCFQVITVLILLIGYQSRLLRRLFSHRHTDGLQAAGQF